MSSTPEWVKKEKAKPVNPVTPKVSEALQRRMDYPIGKKQ